MRFKERWSRFVDKGTEGLTDINRIKFVRIMNGVFLFSLLAATMGLISDFLVFVSKEDASQGEMGWMLIMDVATCVGTALVWYVHRLGFSLLSYSLLLAIMSAMIGFNLCYYGDTDIHYIFLSAAVYSIATLRPWKLALTFASYCFAALVASDLWLITHQPLGHLSDSMRALQTTVNLAIVASAIIAITIHLILQSNRIEKQLLDAKRTAEELSDKARLSEVVFTNTTEGIMVTDRRCNMVSVNNGFTEITGYEEDEALGRNPRILSSGKHKPAYYKNLWADIERTGQWRGHFWNKRRNGDLYLQESCINRVLDENAKVISYVAILRDVTKRFEAEEKIKHMANHDNLTDLPTRTLFMDRVSMAIKIARRTQNPVAILFLDLDGFKNVNDTYGHDAGDRVLKVVSKRLTTILRESDTLARFGGDEFAILLVTNADRNGAAIVARKVIDKICEPIELGDKKTAIGASVGIGMFPEHGDKIEHLIKEADQAMYAVKKNGKNSFQFAS